MKKPKERVFVSDVLCQQIIARRARNVESVIAVIGGCISSHRVTVTEITKAIALVLAGRVFDQDVPGTDVKKAIAAVAIGQITGQRVSIAADR